MGEPQRNGHSSSVGNRPSSTILADRLDPFVLGQLISLYEHKVFTIGALLQINSFDQWGVELGKKLSDEVYDKIKSKDRSNIDNSTKGQLDFIKKIRS